MASVASTPGSQGSPGSPGSQTPQFPLPSHQLHFPSNLRVNFGHCSLLATMRSLLLLAAQLGAALGQDLTCPTGSSARPTTFHVIGASGGDSKVDSYTF